MIISLAAAAAEQLKGQMSWLVNHRIVTKQLGCKNSNFRIQEKKNFLQFSFKAAAEKLFHQKCNFCRKKTSEKSGLHLVFVILVWDCSCKKLVFCLFLCHPKASGCINEAVINGCMMVLAWAALDLGSIPFWKACSCLIYSCPSEGFRVRQLNCYLRVKNYFRMTIGMPEELWSSGLSSHLLSKSYLVLGLFPALSKWIFGVTWCAKKWVHAYFK